MKPYPSVERLAPRPQALVVRRQFIVIVHWIVAVMLLQMAGPFLVAGLLFAMLYFSVATMGYYRYMQTWRTIHVVAVEFAIYCLFSISLGIASEWLSGR